MFDSSIDDRLHRLNEEFRKLLGNSTEEHFSEKTTPEQLAHLFGLKINQAKSWLNKEPNYVPSNDLSQKERSNEEDTEPKKAISSFQHVIQNTNDRFTSV